MHGRCRTLSPGLRVKPETKGLVIIGDKWNRQRITRVALDTLFLAACMYRRTIVGGHGRVNSFNWYTLQNPFDANRCHNPLQFLLGIRRPSQIIAIAHFPEDI